MSSSLQRNTVIAFDPGINDTGVAVIKGDALLHSGTLKPKGDSMSERLGSLMASVDQIFQTYPPDTCIIERASHFSYSRSADPLSGKDLNAKSILINGYATAVIMAIAGRRNIPVKEMNAHQWKIMGGKNLNKDAMKTLARSLCPAIRQKQILSSHEAEAICMCYLNNS